MAFAQNDNYLFDTILVTLKTNANNRTKIYTCADFSNIACISVEDLTTKTNDKIDLLVKKAIEGGALTSEEIKFVKGTSSFKRILRLKLSTNTKESLIGAIRQLRKRGDILYADPDYHIEYKSIEPNDPGYINNPTDGYQWYMDEINLPQAWDITTGSYSTRVCIIDTKINTAHEEFSDYTAGEHALSSNIADAGHHVCTLTYGGGGVQSYSWSTNYSSLEYGRHGTIVAGIIGANTNNGIGMAGVCWNIELVSYAYKEVGSLFPTSSAIADAIEMANAALIPIINLSGGWYANDPRYSEPDIEPNVGDANYTDSLKAAIDNYYGLIVCAAGNEGRDNDGSNPLYPASYDCDNIISVGASDRSNNRVVYSDEDASNYGRETVDLFAPGIDMMGPNYNFSGQNKYLYGLTGTSYAAPLVTGVAALLVSKYPCLSATEIKETILDNVDEITALDGLCVTGGRLNAYAALSNCQPSHDGVWEWETSNTYGHTGYCTCGELVTKAHTYSYSNVTNTTHKQTCTACGYNSVVLHLWVVTSRTVTGHVKECACGREVDELHTWVQNALGGYMCSVCRQTGNFIPGIKPLLTSKGQLLLQSANLQHGQVILIDGLPIIYFNGEYYLLTDSAIENPTPVPPTIETE